MGHQLATRDTRVNPYSCTVSVIMGFMTCTDNETKYASKAHLSTVARKPDKNL